MASMKHPTTFGEFLDAVAAVAQKKGNLTEAQAKWLIAQEQVKQIAGIGWNIRNTPAKVFEALVYSLASSWINHAMTMVPKSAKPLNGGAAGFPETE